jgi:hypothetical protein
LTIKKTVGVLFVNKKSNNELSKLIEDIELSKKFRMKKLYYKLTSSSNSGYFLTQFEDFLRKIHTLLHLALIWKNRNSTLNFKMKAYNMFGTRQQAKSHSSFASYEKLRMSFYERMLVKLFGNSLGVNFLDKLVLLFFRIKSLFEPGLLKDLDCLLVMHGGRICIEQDYLIWFARLNSIKTIAIQENWDNLSSKTILYQHPDFFATWGKQSTSHLKQIHDFQGITCEIGSRRLNAFFDYRNLILKGKQNKNGYVNKRSTAKKILLVGSGDGQYDFIIAEECMRIINHHAKSFHSTFSIIYRPHPHSPILEENIQRLKTLSGVYIDKPASHEVDDYRLNLILQSELIISLYSTMLLESCILNKLCIVPSFIKSSWNFPTKKFLDKAEHYLGMSTFDGLLNPDSYEEFVDILIKIEKNELHPINNKDLLEWFCADIDSIASLCNLIESSF